MTDNLNWLLDTTDAQVWAREFCRLFVDESTKTGTVDADLMLTWFANAMAAQEMATNGTAVKKLDTIYAERNALVIAFAKLSAGRGDRVGWIEDEREPDWPVLVIDTPEGQVSWHFKKDEMPEWVGRYPRQWDGHDDAEKYRRLAALDEF